MAFYHADGFPSAWKQAAKFAGQGGYIATAPDIVAARLATGPDDYPWSAYFTTTTAEYFGKSKEGKYILIIAHGVGPMATLDGIQRAYSWEYQDKSRARRGGRITEQEFHNLEAGKYGEVTIVDYEAYCGLYEYPLCGVLRTSEALMDPILKARFGSRTEEYVQAHAEHARRWHREQAGLNPNNRYQLPDNDGRHEEMMRLGHQLQGAEGSDPYILDVNGASNCIVDLQGMGKFLRCYGTQESSLARVSGFTIRNGLASGSSPSGGAIELWVSDVSIDGCRFENCQAPRGFGGAVSAGASGTRLRDCVFVGNRAKYGGALRIGSSTLEATGVVSCLFDDNRADSGGAILANKRDYVIKVLLPSFGSWVAKLIVIAIFLAAYSIPVTFHTVMSVVGGNSLANTVSFTPGGVGITQAVNSVSLSSVTTTANATAYSLGQQLIITAWNVAFAIVIVTWVFGWTGGKQLVGTSYTGAKEKAAEQSAAHKARKAEKKAQKQATKRSADDA